MTDKDKIRNIIELFVAWNGETDIIDIANLDSAVDFIVDSLQEEPVSEDVVISVAKQYIDSHVFGNEEDKFTRSVLVDMFCSGAKWQKEKDEEEKVLTYKHGFDDCKELMMTKAIDAEVLENYDGKVIKYDETILDEKLSDCKVFDKIKLIMLKED